eukprot:3200282-Rhodomonas_salina.1
MSLVVSEQATNETDTSPPNTGEACAKHTRPQRSEPPKHRRSQGTERMRSQGPLRASTRASMGRLSAGQRRADAMSVPGKARQIAHFWSVRSFGSTPRNQIQETAISGRFVPKMRSGVYPSRPQRLKAAHLRDWRGVHWTAWQHRAGRESRMWGRGWGDVSSGYGHPTKTCEDIAQTELACAAVRSWGRVLCERTKLGYAATGS